MIGLGELTRVVDRDTVDDVLGKANRHQTSARLIPARAVVHLVLALCLLTSDGYDEVVRKLTNGLRGLQISCPVSGSSDTIADLASPDSAGSGGDGATLRSRL